MLPSQFNATITNLVVCLRARDHPRVTERASFPVTPAPARACHRGHVAAGADVRRPARPYGHWGSLRVEHWGAPPDGLCAHPQQQQQHDPRRCRRMDALRLARNGVHTPSNVRSASLTPSSSRTADRFARRIARDQSRCFTSATHHIQLWCDFDTGSLRHCATPVTV